MDPKSKVIASGVVGTVLLVAGTCILVGGWVAEVTNPAYPSANVCELGQMFLQAHECIDTSICCDAFSAGDCTNYCVINECWAVYAPVTLQKAPYTGGTGQLLIEDGLTLHQADAVLAGYYGEPTVPCFVNGCCQSRGSGCPAVIPQNQCIVLSFYPADDKLIAGSVLLAVGGVLVCVMLYFLWSWRRASNNKVENV